MNIRRGDIVLVDFPYSAQTGRKVRPALVVQSNLWNQRLDDTILALITSSRRRRVDATTQYFIDISTAEGQQTGLRINSVVQCENLITYDQSLILRVIGNLSASAMRQIDACLNVGHSLNNAIRAQQSRSLRGRKGWKGRSNIPRIGGYN